MNSLKCDKCDKTYTRPQDLGRHKYFAHGVKGKHHKYNKRYANRKKNGVEQAIRTLDHRSTSIAETQANEADFQFEGFSAFVAGQVYRLIKEGAEAFGIPYASLAGRVFEFIHATSNRKQLGNTNRVSFLPSKTAP